MIARDESQHLTVTQRIINLYRNEEKDRETQIKVAMIHARDNDTNAQLNLQKGMRELDIKEREVDHELFS